MQYKTRRLESAISKLPQHEQFNYAIRIIWKYILYSRSNGRYPYKANFRVSAHLPFVTSLVMFSLLPLMPVHPAAIPATFGSALSIAIIYLSIFRPRRALAVHWVR
jgi:hypothetical protein